MVDRVTLVILLTINWKVPQDIRVITPPGLAKTLLNYYLSSVLLYRSLAAWNVWPWQLDRRQIAFLTYIPSKSRPKVSSFITFATFHFKNKPSLIYALFYLTPVIGLKPKTPFPLLQLASQMIPQLGNSPNPN